MRCKHSGRPHIRTDSDGQLQTQSMNQSPCTLSRIYMYMSSWGVIARCVSLKKKTSAYIFFIDGYLCIYKINSRFCLLVGTSPIITNTPF